MSFDMTRTIRKIFRLDSIKLFIEFLRYGELSNFVNLVKIQFASSKERNQFQLQIFSDLNANKGKPCFPLIPAPVVSIIIPAHNQWDHTYSCLQSILANTVGMSYEVIVADDCSTDDTRNIADLAENITVIRNETNLGFLRTCNRAAAKARGKYLLFLNNDTNVQPDWLRQMVALADQDPLIGIVGAKLVYPDGRLQEAGGIIWRDGTGLNYGKFDDPERSEYNYVKDVDYVSGACLMIRRELWELVGGFDERFAPAYFEDTDLAFAARQAGYRVVYQPKAVIVHFEGVSCGTDESQGIKAYQSTNRLTFVEKHKHALEMGCSAPKTCLFLARERGQEKKTILVIDQYLPQYDKDAGSRATFMYLQLFLSMGLKVVFMGDNFHRDEPYCAVLQQMGVEVLYGEWYEQNWQGWVIANAQFIDFVYLNRPRISERYIDFLKKQTKAMIIYQGHDLHYLRVMRRYELEGGARLLKQANRLEQVEAELVRKSDAVVTFSDVERRIISEKWGKVSVAVPLFFYEDVPEGDSDPLNRSDIMFVGGFGLSANVDAVAWFVRDILPLLSERLQGAKFHVIGSNPPEEILALASDRVVVRGYVSDEELAVLYRQVRLVVIPLRYGAGVKGKVLEAMYHGVPMVATTIAVEGIPCIEQVVSPRDNALDIADAVQELYGEDTRWREISRSYRCYLRNQFSREKAVEIMSEILHI